MNTPKYQSAIYNKMARLYSECLAVRKAHEFSEAAALLARELPILNFKYKIERVRTQRKLGDYIEALAGLDALGKEIAE